MVKHLTILVVSLSLSVSLPAQAHTLLFKDFQLDETSTSWQLVDAVSSTLAIQGQLRSSEIDFTGARLKSPRFALIPLRYYRLRMKLRSSKKLL